MASIIKFAKTIRNNWKKSVFAAAVVSYGASYANDKIKINQLMREYCTEASKYGDTKVDAGAGLHKVIVLLNPAANKRSAEKLFEKYCEPILHLGGLAVEIIKTDSEGHARKYVEELQVLPRAILVAGGDGTLSEAVTGMLRRPNRDQCPIGILPLGRTNSLGSKMFFTNSDPNDVESADGLAKSAMSILTGNVQKRDVMKIEVIDESTDDDLPKKPIYAVGSLEWGAFRDIINLRDKYWYTGPFREYFALLFNAFSSKPTWSCDAKLTYTPPCGGCSNCYFAIEPEIIQSTGRWWSRFIPKSKPSGNQQPRIDYSKIKNDECPNKYELEVNSSELILKTRNLIPIQNEPNLAVQIGKEETSSIDFIKSNWKRIKALDDVNPVQSVNVRTVEIVPNQISTEEKEKFYSIDKESYEVKPIKITLVPNAINLFA